MMNHNAAIVWLSILGFAMSWQSGEAIKCYVCQSNIDPKCADPFDNLTLPITDCNSYPRADLALQNQIDSNEDKGFFGSFLQVPSVKPLMATMCQKIRQKVDGEWRTIRGCGYLGPPGELPLDRSDSSGRCQMRYGSYNVFMESCICNNKDGCNSSNNLQLLTPMTILMLISAFALNHLIINSRHTTTILG